jgi:DNA-binding PadR family transcriptional regulator
VREALLALLSKEPSHGYELHQRLSAVFGDAQAELNPGQVYVALSRLERGGLVAVRDVPQGSRPDKKVYEVTAAGREMVVRWLAEQRADEAVHGGGLAGTTRWCSGATRRSDLMPARSLSPSGPRRVGCWLG